MKTFLTIITTAIVVGVGVYFWQSPKTEEEIVRKKTEPIHEESIQEEVLKEVSHELAMEQIEQNSRELLLPDEKGIYQIGDIDMKDLQKYCSFEPQIDPANISVKYTDETGLSFLLPFNMEWGTSHHKINPYDKKGDKVLFGPVHLEGYPTLEGSLCGIFERFYSLEIIPHRETEDIVDEFASKIGKGGLAHLETWRFWDSPTTTIDFVGFSMQGELGGNPTIIEVIGPKYNYKFIAKNYPSLEEFKKIVLPIIMQLHRPLTKFIY